MEQFGLFPGGSQNIHLALQDCDQRMYHFLNKQRNSNNISIDDTDVYLLEKLKSDTYFNGDNIQRKLQEAILRLPDKQRLVFNMKYFDDMTYEQISEIVGTTTGALKASYHYAVKKIEEYLTKDV